MPNAYNQKHSIATDFYFSACPRCGGTYAIIEEVRAEHQRRGTSWHCPYCQCSLSYGGNDIDRANKRVAKAEKKAAEEQRKRTKAEWAHQNTKNTLRSTKGHHTRLKKRIANGVCPCCDRTFPDVGAHIRQKHPEYSEANE